MLLAQIAAVTWLSLIGRSDMAFVRRGVVVAGGTIAAAVALAFVVPAVPVLVRLLVVIGCFCGLLRLARPSFRLAAPLVAPK
jgi:hypothetical protein